MQEAAQLGHCMSSCRYCPQGTPARSMFPEEHLQPLSHFALQVQPAFPRPAHQHVVPGAAHPVKMPGDSPPCHDGPHTPCATRCSLRSAICPAQAPQADMGPWPLRVLRWVLGVFVWSLIGSILWIAGSAVLRRGVGLPAVAPCTGYSVRGDGWVHVCTHVCVGSNHLIVPMSPNLLTLPSNGCY